MIYFVPVTTDGRSGRVRVEADDEWEAQGKASLASVAKVTKKRPLVTRVEIAHAIPDGEKVCAWGCCEVK